MFRFRPLPCLVAICFPLNSSFAHHGQDFLLLQDAASTKPLDGSLFSNFEWSSSNGFDELGLESGFQLGIAPRLTLGATVEFGDEGNGWDYSSVMPYLHLDLTPKDLKWPIRIAIMGGYQFANHANEKRETIYVIEDAPAANPPVKSTVKHRRANQSSSATAAATTAPATTSPPVTTPEEPEEPEEPTPCGPAYGPDAPPCPETLPLYHANHPGHQEPVVIVAPAPVTAPTPPGAQANSSTPGNVNDAASPAASKKDQKAAQKKARQQTQKALKQAQKKAESAQSETGGIHRHDENYFFGRIIIEADLTHHDKLVLNVINLVPEKGKPAWGYGAGLRHSFNHTWAVGLEAQGDFGDANEHELVLGGYFSPIHTATFKLGVGCGLTEESADFSLRTGLVWRF